MPATDPRIVIDELGDRSCEAGVAAGGCPQGLKSNDVVSREDIGKRRGRDVGNERGLASRLARAHGIAIQAPARVAEAELVDRSRCQVPCVFARDAVGSCKGVAAAIREGCSEFAVVAKKCIAAEDAMLCAEVAVEASVQLIGNSVVVAKTLVVIGYSAGAGVGGGVTVQYRLSRTIDAMERDGIARERISQVAGCGAARGGGIKDRSREQALLLRRGRNGAGTDHSGIEPRPLPIGEEECFVLLDGSAEDPAVLVAAEARLGDGCGEEVTGIELLVAEKLEERAVHGVGAGFLIDHDHAAVGTAILRGIAVRIHAELFDCVDDGVESHLAGLGLQNTDAVVDVFADSRPAAIDAGQKTSWRQIDTWGKGDKWYEVPAIERERDHFLLIHDKTDRAATRLQQGWGGAYLDRLTGITQVEIEVEPRAVSDPQGDSVLL